MDAVVQDPARKHGDTAQLKVMGYLHVLQESALWYSGNMGYFEKCAKTSRACAATSPST